MENKKNLKSLRNDKRAVSPVIGVILMVAITVILAAVIGAFVFGITPTAESAPQASLNARGWTTTGFVLDHNGGDTIKTSEIDVFVNGVKDPGPTWTLTAGGSLLAAGETATYNSSTTFDNGDSVKLIDRESQQLVFTATARI